MIKNIGTEGTHSVAEDINHNVTLGSLNPLPLIRNDSAGYMQDEQFFKSRVPSILKMLVIDFLQIMGVYGYVSTCYRTVKAAKKN